MFEDLRGFLTHLESHKQLLRVKDAVDVKYEIAAGMLSESKKAAPKRGDRANFIAVIYIGLDPAAIHDRCRLGSLFAATELCVPFSHFWSSPGLALCTIGKSMKRDSRRSHLDPPRPKTP